jgi:hypothetical protein
VPGTSIACTGPGACSGYQVCNQVGSGFEPCDCTLDAGGDSTLSFDSGTDASEEAHSADGNAEDAGQDVSDAFVANDGLAVLNGAIQKGPFVLGSTVTLSAIDGAGVPTGQVFNTQTTSDLGAFSVSFAYRGNVDMQAQGFYYDEVTGSLSNASIVLRALYQVTNGGPQGAYINLITHLAHDRALALLGDGGTGLQAAEAQAEGELVTALGIGGSGFQPGGVGVNLNELGGDNDQNAYLFAVSAVLVQAAREQAGDGGSVDAQLQQLIDTIAADLVNGGSLPSGLISQLRTAEHDLDVDLTMDFFAQHLQAIGSTSVLADLNRAVDSDGDGYRNSVDTCPLVANPNQAVVPGGVLCKAMRHTTFLTAGEGETAAMFNACAVVGDFEKSGHLGLLACGLAGSQASAGLSAGDGTGRFLTPAAVPLQSFVPVFSYDVDQNGQLDLVSRGGWAAGNGAGQFGAPSPFPGPAGVGTPSYYAVALADFNGDHKVDVARLFTTATSAEPAVSLGLGNGAFAAPTELGSLGPATATAYHPPSLLAGDMNGDNNVDLVYVGAAQGCMASIVTLLGDGSGGFKAGTPT